MVRTFLYIFFLNNLFGSSQEPTFLVFNHFDKFTPVQGDFYKPLNNVEFKSQINERLSADETYDYILEKKCQITGNMHDRHKVRWVKAFFLKNFFQNFAKLNQNLPYYVNILLHSLLIFLTLIFLNKSFNLEDKHILFFLLYISYVFQNHLGEYSYSIFEMFFVSVAIFASKNKKILLLIVVSTLAVLNRESGMLIPFIWLVFNKDLKKVIICLATITIIFIIVNWHLISCILNPKFFIPMEYQGGQINFSDIVSINIISLVKLFLINFIIPFGIIFYNYVKYNSQNKFLLGLTVIYILMFLFATPLHHLAVRLIILPIIVLSFYLGREEKIN